MRGVYIDAEEPSGKCVIFPCYYLRVLLQRDEENQKGEPQNGKQKAVILEKISIDTKDLSNHVCKKEMPGT